MEERLSMVTTECEKVQIITAITSVQTLRHGLQSKKSTRTLSVTNEHQNVWCLSDPECPGTPCLDVLTNSGGAPCLAVFARHGISQDHPPETTPTHPGNR